MHFLLLHTYFFQGIIQIALCIKENLFVYLSDLPVIMSGEAITKPHTQSYFYCCVDDCEPIQLD